MPHTCQDCDHKFFDAGQSQDSISPAVQCPRCHSYRTQPTGIPDENNDMVHGIGAMPNEDQADDMSGNPLKEGILADGGWKNRQVRDESFASVRRSRVSLFETPEFETTGIVAPPDLYRYGLETEAAHRTGIQIPKGITDNLHAALGTLGAWVENPYENGQLRPYYNKYWKTIRPSFMKPGALQIGVAEPTMAEIINHVAQTDDLTPLYEYRGKQSHVKTGGQLALLAPEAIAGAGAAEGASGAGGIAGMMMRAAPGLLGMSDDVLGTGGSGGGSGGGDVPQTVHDQSFYARNASEDDAYPSVHGEIPKQDDGDYHQQDDGNHHEWQRDISVNDIGGTQHSPSFDPGGEAIARFMAIFPLLKQYTDSGEDGSQDPLIQGLHEALESELPGYLGHGNEDDAQKLIMILAPNQAAKPEANDADHTDENSGGKHSSKVASLKVASLHGEVAEFLPDLEVTLPSLNGFRVAQMPMPGPQMGGGPMAGPSGGAQPSPMSGPSAMPATPPTSPDESNQGPVTDEQQAFFAKYLMAQGRAEEIPIMLANPELYQKEFAQVRGKEIPPQSDDINDQQPPMPAQEEAPPEDTMPVPGMEQQMMSAVQRYGADNIATQCPHCGGHTTALMDEDGRSFCHSCHKEFKTEGKKPNKIDTTARWTVEADADTHSFESNPVAGPDSSEPLPSEHEDPARPQHTWTDDDGNPLQKGQEYEMYSDRYDIPDIVKLESVKPDALVYRLTGEFGLQHAAQLTKQEANIEGTSFKPTTPGAEVDSDPSLEENNDDNTGYTGDPQHVDMSAPRGLVAAGVNSKLAWLTDGLPRTSGANFTPMEQRSLIDEPGVARNAGLLQLDGTHYTEPDDLQFLFGF